MINATVRITREGEEPFIYDHDSRSIATIWRVAEALAGDGPHGISVMVKL